MKKRYIAGAVAGGIIALWTAKMSMKMAHDLRRYNHIRSLSDEGPIQEETPDMLLQLATQERHWLIAMRDFFKAIPHDVARDAKIFSM
jgi:hypothetical protein